MMRYRTLAARHAVVLLPVFGDWKGTGTPVVNLLSRNGQLMDLALFDSQGNYNAVVAASSGAGKSFFCLTTLGGGIGRLVVDPFRRLLYSTAPQDVAALDALRRQGKGVAEAIHRLQAGDVEEATAHQPIPGWLEPAEGRTAAFIEDAQAIPDRAGAIIACAQREKACEATAGEGTGIGGTGTTEPIIRLRADARVYGLDLPAFQAQGSEHRVLNPTPRHPCAVGCVGPTVVSPPSVHSILSRVGRTRMTLAGASEHLQAGIVSRHALREPAAPIHGTASSQSAGGAPTTASTI